jgi:phosphonate transport system substrate-binding protein
MVKKVFLFLAAWALIVPFPSLAHSAAPPMQIVIGLIPEMNVFAQMERFKPLAEYLTEQTGIPVKLKILSRYGNIIDHFTSEGMDGAFFGSFTGAMAIQKLGVVPLVRPVNLDGESTYCGLIFIRKGSGIRSMKDLKGKRFAFVERATTAGYIYPVALLREQGVSNWRSFFSDHYFTGSHDASIYAVLEGKADAGAAKNSVYTWMRSKEPRVDRELQVLSESIRVPSNGLCVRKDLDENVKKKIRNALLNLHSTSRGKEVLAKFRALRFIEASPADYAPVLDLAKKAGIDPATYRYKND